MIKIIGVTGHSRKNIFGIGTALPVILEEADEQGPFVFLNENSTERSYIKSQTRGMRIRLGSCSYFIESIEIDHVQTYPRIMTYPSVLLDDIETHLGCRDKDRIRIGISEIHSWDRLKKHRGFLSGNMEPVGTHATFECLPNSETELVLLECIYNCCLQKFAALLQTVTLENLNIAHDEMDHYAYWMRQCHPEKLELAIVSVFMALHNQARYRLRNAQKILRSVSTRHREGIK